MTEKHFAEALKRYRLDRQWTLQQLSNVTGVSVSALAYLEKGKRKPHDLTVAKILKALPALKEVA